MDSLIFLGLLLVSVFMIWTLQIISFLATTRRWAGPDNGFRKAFKTWLRFVAINLAARLVWGFFSLVSNAPGWMNFLGSVMTLIIALFVVQGAYRIRTGRAAAVLAIPLVLGLIGFFSVRGYVGQAFSIPTEGMAPALQSGDHLFAAKYAYRLNEPERGDIAVFRHPEMESAIYVKRIIGLPGETIAVRSYVVTIDGEPLVDPWGSLDGPLHTAPRKFDLDSVVIPEGEYFVLGDNRLNSQDSRFWGTLPRENLVGKAMVLYWPLQRMGAP